MTDDIIKAAWDGPLLQRLARTLRRGRYRYQGEVWAVEQVNRFWRTRHGYRLVAGGVVFARLARERECHPILLFHFVMLARPMD